MVLVGSNIYPRPFGVVQQLIRHLLPDLGASKLQADGNTQLQKSPTV